MLTTAQVAKLAAVAPSTVKRWAEQGILPHTRTAGGHRRFERQALEQFLQHQAHSAASASHPPVEDPAARAEPQNWLRLLNDGNAHAIDSALRGAYLRQGSWFRVADELGGLLTQLGTCWASGQVTVAEEHLISAALSRALQRICDHLPVGMVTTRNYAVACAPNDDHSLGLNLAELCLREVGVGCLWLGRATPQAELIRLVEREAVQGLALSASAYSSDRSLLAEWVSPVEQACAEHGVPLILGGCGAWPDPPQYGHRLHRFADFHALLRSY